LYLYFTVQKLGLKGFPRQGDLSLSCPLFLLMILGFVGIELYYRRAVGQVKLEHGPISSLILIMVIMIIGIVGWMVDTAYIIPVSLFALFMGICSMIFGWLEKRPFQFSIGILLIIAGLLPIFLLKSPKDAIFGTSGFLIMLLIFLLFTVGGIIDHLTIMRSLRPSLFETDLKGGEDVRAR